MKKVLYQNYDPTKPPPYEPTQNEVERAKEYRDLFKDKFEEDRKKWIEEIQKQKDNVPQ